MRVIDGSARTCYENTIAVRPYRVLVLAEHSLIPTALAIREALRDLAERLADAGYRVGQETREPRRLTRRSRWQIF